MSFNSMQIINKLLHFNSSTSSSVKDSNGHPHSIATSEQMTDKRKGNRKCINLKTMASNSSDQGSRSEGKPSSSACVLLCDSCKLA